MPELSGAEQPDIAGGRDAWRRGRRTAGDRTAAFPQTKVIESGAKSPQQEALRRLLQADAAAEARREQARANAEKTLAGGEEEVRRLVDAARSSAEAEAAELLQSARLQAAAEAERMRQDARQAIEAMEQRAEQRQAEAVAFLVAWVKAEA